VSDLVPSEPPEVPIGDVLGEVPLFREIQRVLLSSSGPVNWELARQMAIAVASWGSEDPPPTEADLQGLVATVRAAELAVADATGLPMPADLAEVQAHRRAQWVESTLVGLKDLLEPVAAKFGTALSEQGPAGMGVEALGLPPGQGQDILASLMGRMVPLLMGAQVGMAVGHLGQRAFGQYDLAVPWGSGTVSFVVPNIAAFERDWSLDAREFRLWVALHEVTHRFAFAGPWTREHVLRLVHDVVDHAELDLSGMERAMEGIDLSNPEALNSAFEGMGNVLGEATDDEQRLRVARVQAFFAVAEGYADHVMDGVGRRMLGSFDRIQEAVRRHREGRYGDRAFERLIGLETPAEVYRLGRAFCDTVAEQTSEAMLAGMWSSAEALPSMPELEEPTLWLSRTA
jgi:putative hydrolase